MTTRWPAAVLVTCIALAGSLALTGLGRDTTGDRTAGARASTSSTAGGGGLVDVTADLAGQDATVAGTGIVLPAAGEVLTNNHVIRGGTRIRVTTPDGRRYRARVLGTDARHDVALLEIRGAANIAPAALGDSSRVAVGDRVRAIGNADGAGGRPSVAGGRVTGLNRSVTTTDDSLLGSARGSEHLSGLIRTDARLVPGYSGGPLVNAAGQVIGMDTAASVDPPGRQRAPAGFAIPIDRAMAIARAIEAGRGSAGVHVGAAPVLGVELLAGAFPIPLPGVVVSGVVAGSPADAAGLSLGDIITSFDGAGVRSSAAFTRQLDRHHPGDDVRLHWMDPLGGSHVATIRLAAGPPA